MALFWRLFLIGESNPHIHLVYRWRESSKNRDFSRNGKIFLKSRIYPGSALKGLRQLLLLLCEEYETLIKNEERENVGFVKYLKISYQASIIDFLKICDFMIEITILVQLVYAFFVADYL